MSALESLPAEVPKSRICHALGVPRHWCYPDTRRRARARNATEAAILLERWYSWAPRCRLEPIKQVAATLRRHWQGILNAFDSSLTNGRVEAVNSLIQAAEARARGYRTTRHLIGIAYLIAGKLTHLPASPFVCRGCDARYALPGVRPMCRGITPHLRSASERIESTFPGRPPQGLVPGSRHRKAGCASSVREASHDSCAKLPDPVQAG